MSDVHFNPKSSQLLLLNRRILPPYGEGGDTMAVFQMFKRFEGSVYLELLDHIKLESCWQPREFLSLSNDGRTLGVSCVGGDGHGTGIVLLNGHSVVQRWSPGSAGIWGMAVVTT